MVGAAAILRAAGHALPGGQRRLDADRDERDLASTALTEFRAGVFVFFDLFQAGVGVCAPDDIALSVLTDGHRPPARQGLDHHRRRLDGDVARPRHGEAGGRPGLRPRLRPRRPADPRPHRRRRQPGARHRRAAAGLAASRRPTCRSARGCASCRTTPAPRRRSTTATRSSVAGGLARDLAALLGLVSSLSAGGRRGRSGRPRAARRTSRRPRDGRRLARVVADEVLLRDVGDVVGGLVLGEQVIEGLVLARPALLRDRLPPLVGVVEGRDRHRRSRPRNGCTRWRTT